MSGAQLPPRWRRGLSTLLGLPTWPIRKLLKFDTSELANEQRRARGLTLVLSGIEGHGPFRSSLAHGLADTWGGAVEVFDWTTRRLFGTLGHLANHPRNRQMGERLADRIETHWRQHPETAVHLVAHSGGAAIVAFALETLAQRGVDGGNGGFGDRRVGTVLMLAAALSEQYDLADALEACDEIHSFYSPLDVPHLVLGTLLLGTMDRVHGVSAGFQGFRVTHEHLHQHGYQTKMARSWHWGGHMGWTNRVFAAEHLAHYLPPPLCSDDSS